MKGVIPFYKNTEGKNLTKKSGKARYVEPDELILTFESLKGKHALRNKVILYFSHYLGLRAKELAALKVGDVYDLKRQTLKELVQLVGAYTKGDKYREVFLVNAHAKKYLLDYLIQHRDLLEESAPLFQSQKISNDRKGHFSADTMQKMIARIYKNAGIKATSHSGRRSFATNLINSNADIYSVMQLMGHSSIQTTQEYFSSNPNKLKNALIKLN